MRKVSVSVFISLMLLFFSVSTSHAITIGLDPISQTAPVGSTVDVDLWISGLGDFAAPSLGEFDLDINFNPAILSFNSVVFGDSVLGDQLDLFGLGSLTIVDDATPGMVNLFELSFDLIDDLNTLQADNFVMATLTFKIESLGARSLGLSINTLGAADGSSLAANIQGASPVPEPATAFLLISGLAGMGFLSKKKHTHSEIA